MAAALSINPTVAPARDDCTNVQDCMEKASCCQRLCGPEYGSQVTACGSSPCLCDRRNIGRRIGSNIGSSLAVAPPVQNVETVTNPCHFDYNVQPVAITSCGDSTSCQEFRACCTAGCNNTVPEGIVKVACTEQWVSNRGEVTDTSCECSVDPCKGAKNCGAFFACCSKKCGGVLKFQCEQNESGDIVGSKCGC